VLINNKSIIFLSLFVVFLCLLSFTIGYKIAYQQGVDYANTFIEEFTSEPTNCLRAEQITKPFNFSLMNEFVPIKTNETD